LSYPDRLNNAIENGHITRNKIVTVDYAAFYEQLHDSGLSMEGLRLALMGYKKISDECAGLNKKLLTIIDYSSPSIAKRLYVIDLMKDSVVYKSYVAHGKNSGSNHAEFFSNHIQSHKSSLGFYITGSTYYGKHGYSLRLRGLEEEFNDNAWKRAIVMHSASYVSEDFIQNNGRLGRSFGCPAIPVENHQYLIDLIKNNTCLFVYYPDPSYIADSKYIK
jgi:hypothetical protein